LAKILAKIGVFCFCVNFCKKYPRFSREKKIIRETQYREILQKSAHFYMIFAFSRKQKNAFLFQPHSNGTVSSSDGSGSSSDGSSSKVENNV
jgi:hypothetical protein